jgi:hypothetical protein
VILKDQITNIFVQVDELFKEFDSLIKQMKLQVLLRLSLSPLSHIFEKKDLAGIVFSKKRE